MSKADLLLELKKECALCSSCELSAGRTQTVFGDGNPECKVMFIGEGPGANEDKEGLPFVGAAGKLLDRLLLGFDFSRSKNFYIANIVKCRPPGNRDPLPEEQEKCIHFLERQIEIVDPKIIVCLGRVAAQRMISPDFKITMQHGEVFEKDGRFIIATYHPSALLRDQLKLRDCFLDLKTIREKLRDISA